MAAFQPFTDGPTLHEVCSTEKPVSAARKVSLLIVDDDAPIRKLLERVALRAGFDVDTARDGIEALARLEKKNYAIAIIDLMMPRLSGYELVQKIATIDPRPVIIVATAMTDGDVAKVDDTLVKRVIKKPFDVKSVAEALVDTARQIAEAEKPLNVAPPPDNAIIQIIGPEDDVPDKKDEDEKKDGAKGVEPPPRRP
jgi:DNA-binding response OmpR family regulator